MRVVVSGIHLGERLLVVALLCTAAILVSAQELTPAAARPVHHSLRVMIDPDSHRISVEDTINLPLVPANSLLTFELNSNLTITRNSGNLQRQPDISSGPASGSNAGGASAAPASTYHLRLPQRNADQVVLSYSGTIFDVAEQTGAEYAQSFAETSGLIAPEGVYLNGASYWIPTIGDALVTFDLEVEFASAAGDWTVVSQGDRFGAGGWRSEQAMEEVYLVAADFTEYSQQDGEVEVLAYLRQPDPNLAAKYMDATARYLQLYEPLLGDYPYSKFALVENFWETGYGMPSFTLLGSQIIRFPFILESSYPHELLHNWWGNGVYPDYDSGNWSEGLTAYLADHLFSEVDGAGSEYRKEMLARYKNYVAADADFPLADFTSRNSAASQAVGYGKSLMLWHMLRIELGDELFLDGLRQLYAQYQFRRASFDDIAALFSELSGRDLQPFFQQWVQRVGAPELSLSVDAVTGNRARILFAQVQDSEPFTLKVPVALFYAGESEPRMYEIDLSQKLQGFFADDYEQLIGISVDPYFDVFRQLDRTETPPTLGELFGAREIAFVLPATGQQDWRQLAEAFGEGVLSHIYEADELAALPSDLPVWILGKDNPFSSAIATATAPLGTSFDPVGVSLPGKRLDFGDRSTVVIGRHPDNPDLAIGWIAVDNPDAMPGLIEKLPHYGKYSYLSFTGSEPTNDTSGIWSSPDSPLRWEKPEHTGTVPWNRLPAIPPLAELPAKYRQQPLLGHVSALTAESMQGRGIGSAGIDAAARYIADQFRTLGLQTLAGSYLQEWSTLVPEKGTIRLANVVGLLPGSNRDLSAHPLVVGAHYDHLGVDPATGAIYPGADDNGSGISVLLEVAAALSRNYQPERPILFVAFSGEESGLLGSRYFVTNPPSMYQTTELYAMLNLDSVGHLEGRNLQVFGSESAYEFPFMAQGIGYTIGLRSDLLAANLASSDHTSFLAAGVPALHLFGGTHLDYHRTSDTADKLDLQGMSNVAEWLEEAIVYLASNTEPLRVTLSNAAPVTRTASTSAREASLGTVPDFAYVGAGIRITDVVPESAAAEAGLEAGDVLLSFNGQPLIDLQTYSNLLRAAAPGDTVEIEVERNAERIRVEATLKSR